MIDTLNLRLNGGVGGDYLREVSPYLCNVKERVFGDVPCLIARLGGLEVKVSKQLFAVGNGSMCKWFLGDNLKVMRRQDVQWAIEKLSDTFHLPLHDAVVTRLDWAANIVMKQPIWVYLDHLGTPARGWRHRYSGSTLYYHGMNGKTFCFYDKAAEMKDHGECLGQIWKDKNILRVEERYTKRLPICLKVNEVKARDLFEQVFYCQLDKQWVNDVKQIPIVNNININIRKMKTVKDLNRMGILSLVKDNGGQNEFLATIKDMQEKKELTSKQAFDLKKAINEACKVTDGFVAANKDMEEFLRKVSEVGRYAR